MPMTCSVVGSKSRCKSGSKISLFRYPSNDPKWRELWTSAVERPDWRPSKTSKNCSLRFKKSDWLLALDCQNTQLKPDTAPSIFHRAASIIEKSTDNDKSDEKPCQVKKEENSISKSSSSKCDAAVIKLQDDDKIGTAEQLRKKVRLIFSADNKIIIMPESIPVELSQLRENHEKGNEEQCQIKKEEYSISQSSGGKCNAAIFKLQNDDKIDTADQLTKKVRLIFSADNKIIIMPESMPAGLSQLTQIHENATVQSSQIPKKQKSNHGFFRSKSHVVVSKLQDDEIDAAEESRKEARVMISSNKKIITMPEVIHGGFSQSTRNHENVNVKQSQVPKKQNLIHRDSENKLQKTSEIPKEQNLISRTSDGKPNSMVSKLRDVEKIDVAEQLRKKVRLIFSADKKIIMMPVSTRVGLSKLTQNDNKANEKQSYITKNTSLISRVYDGKSDSAVSKSQNNDKIDVGEQLRKKVRLIISSDKKIVEVPQSICAGLSQSTQNDNKANEKQSQVTKNANLISRVYDGKPDSAVSKFQDKIDAAELLRKKVRLIISCNKKVIEMPQSICAGLSQSTQNDNKANEKQSQVTKNANLISRVYDGKSDSAVSKSQNDDKIDSAELLKKKVRLIICSDKKVIEMPQSICAGLSQSTQNDNKANEKQSQVTKNANLISLVYDGKSDSVVSKSQNDDKIDSAELLRKKVRLIISSDKKIVEVPQSICVGLSQSTQNDNKANEKQSQVTKNVNLISRVYDGKSDSVVSKSQNDDKIDSAELWRKKVRLTISSDKKVIEMPQSICAGLSQSTQNDNKANEKQSQVTKNANLISRVYDGKSDSVVSKSQNDDKIDVGEQSRKKVRLIISSDKKVIEMPQSICAGPLQSTQNDNKANEKQSYITKNANLISLVYDGKSDSAISKSQNDDKIDSAELLRKKVRLIISCDKKVIEMPQSICAGLSQSTQNDDKANEKQSQVTKNANLISRVYDGKSDSVVSKSQNDDKIDSAELLRKKVRLIISSDKTILEVPQSICVGLSQSTQNDNKANEKQSQGTKNANLISRVYDGKSDSVVSKSQNDDKIDSAELLRKKVRLTISSDKKVIEMPQSICAGLLQSTQNDDKANEMLSQVPKEKNFNHQHSDNKTEKPSRLSKERNSIIPSSDGKPDSTVSKLQDDDKIARAERLRKKVRLIISSDKKMIMMPVSTCVGLSKLTQNDNKANENKSQVTKEHNLLGRVSDGKCDNVVSKFQDDEKIDGAEQLRKRVKLIISANKKVTTMPESIFSGFSQSTSHRSSSNCSDAVLVNTKNPLDKENRRLSQVSEQENVHNGVLKNKFTPGLELRPIVNVAKQSTNNETTAPDSTKDGYRILRKCKICEESFSSSDSSRSTSNYKPMQKLRKRMKKLSRRVKILKQTITRRDQTIDRMKRLLKLVEKGRISSDLNDIDHA